MTFLPPRRLSCPTRLTRLTGRLAFGLLAATAWAQSDAEYEKPPIAYSETPSRDAVAAMLEAQRRGEITFSGDDKAVLGQLLAALDIPVASQLLVFSKTSLQIDLIRPENPRALYFNDLVSVGWVPGGDFELAAFSPGLGAVFYRLAPDDLRARPPQDQPLAMTARDQDCLRCHGGLFTSRVPGLFIRSVPTGQNGSPRFHLGSRVVDHTTPLEQRWGGYYVTGQPGGLAHLGNTFTGPDEARAAVGANRLQLAEFFDPGRYLTGTSDVVALMVIEHQTTVLTALTKADFQCRQRLAYQQAIQRDLGEPVTEAPNDVTLRVLEASVLDVLDALLFKDEAPLPEDGVTGGEAFREAFARRSRPVQGRSLRDFQLLNRLFKYRCSYLIESDAFATLHPPLRRRVLRRLHDVMTGRDADDRYAYLHASERDTIHRLLTARLPEYAALLPGPASENSQ